MYKLSYNNIKNDYLNINNQSGGKKMKNKKHYIKHNNNNNTNNMTMHLSEPWFTLISMGHKTVEGRKNKGVFKDMKIGEVITWFNDDFNHREIKTKVIRKTEYKTFRKYLETEGLDKCLPGIPTMEHGLSVYFKYFTHEDELNYGVIAIELELL